MQTKPIRGATGADITENTLRITLQDLNIGKEIRELSYVEKRLIMVISLTKQLANAEADLARTMCKHSCLKILKKQEKRLGYDKNMNEIAQYNIGKGNNRSFIWKHISNNQPKSVKAKLLKAC